MSSAAVSFKTFLGIAPYIMASLHPILLRGRHGIGKSSVIYQIAEAEGLEVVERRASQMTEGDLLGMPSATPFKVNGQLASKFIPFGWFIKACTEGVILFLDEVDRATPEVRQAIFELCDSRKLAGHKLHPETVIFAAVNGGANGSQYQVAVMDPAELDRYTTFDIEPTTEDWLDWAKAEIHPVVWDFINHNRSHLEHIGEFNDGEVYPSRRSWERLNKCCAAAILFEKDSDRDLLFNLANGYVGFEAAVALRDFVENYSFQVSIEDLLDHGALDKVAKWGINDHAAMIEKMSAAGTMEVALSPGQIQNLADYFMLLPSEVAMKLWTCLGEANIHANIVALHAARATDGKEIAMRLVTILGGDTGS